ncbi:hypothetical protein B0H17DRAFT_1135423 [Mycena rosella]|uniref:Uncharacterized protein n=1 Tax=Mycena rosella TaxID=1033263 RepID=A0AAD7GD02_MYCRO|nr:hypothetical protein B0H17DRAFT_1135423 [Mycena rosella]
MTIFQTAEYARTMLQRLKPPSGILMRGAFPGGPAKTAHPPPQEDEAESVGRPPQSVLSSLPCRTKGTQDGGTRFEPISQPAVPPWAAAEGGLADVARLLPQDDGPNSPMAVFKVPLDSSRLSVATKTDGCPKLERLAGRKSRIITRLVSHCPNDDG